MADVNGNPVYPLLYNGTTYLPIRAVSNMLGLNVDWDGATQTVLLGKSSTSDTSTDSSAESNKDNNSSTTTVTIPISNPSVDKIRKFMKMLIDERGYPDYIIEDAVAEFKAYGPNDKNGKFIYTFELSKKDTFKTSRDTHFVYPSFP